MSDTPRTDQRAFKAAFLPPEAIVTADFGRELEQELAQRTAEVAKANAERDEARRDLCVSEAIDRLHEANPNAPISYGESRRIAREIAAEYGWDCFEKEVKP
jgi:hypothetical protein